MLSLCIVANDKGLFCTILSISKMELIPGGGFRPSDESTTEYYRYLNAHKDYNPWLKWSAFICRFIGYIFFSSDIIRHHQYIVSNVNPLSLNFMKDCLNFTYHLFKTWSRRLKLFNVCTVPATVWSQIFTFQNMLNYFSSDPSWKS